MGKRVGLLAGVLVVGLGSGAVAQSPPSSASSPPSWVEGQRVQMSEHGFAVTVPDGWVGIDPDGDEDAQARVAVRWSSPEATAADVRSLAERIASARQEGVQFILTDGATESVCTITLRAKRAIETGEFADRLAATLSSDDRYSDVEPPTAITLPAGPSFVIIGSVTQPGVSMGPSPLTYYLIDSDVSVLIANCVGPERPADDWLSIVQTLEVLPREDLSGAPWFGGRVAMPERAVAFSVPDGWVGIDLKADIDRQLTRVAGSLGPDNEQMLRAGIDRVSVPGDWLVLVDSANGDACGMTGYAGASAPSLTEIGQGMADNLANNPTVTNLEPSAFLDVPMGPAVRIHLTVADPYRPVLSGTVTIYMVFDDERHHMVLVSCSALAGRPTGDWLAIVESLESLAQE